MRHEFSLPEEDEESLNALNLPWETIKDGGLHWLLLHQMKFPDGLTHNQGSVAIQIPPGYPTAGLDMAYFFPQLSRQDGHQLRQCQVQQSIDGKAWQRWSRHYAWLPGIHSVSTHVVLINRWLEAAISG